MIVMINGSGGSGKDTVVDMYKIVSKENVHNLSTIDSVKAVAAQIGWNGKKDAKSRKFLSDLKDSWTKFNNGIFIEICDAIDYIKANNPKATIFVHCREPEEIAEFADMYEDDLITLLITRESSEEFDNHADSNVDNYKYDHTITNDESYAMLLVKVEALSSVIGKYPY